MYNPHQGGIGVVNLAGVEFLLLAVLYTGISILLLITNVILHFWDKRRMQKQS
jgi:uncharacterized membrane protein YqjE